MTSELNAAFICKLIGSLMCLADYFDMLSMGDCTTRHWQMFSRLVEEIEVDEVVVSQWRRRVRQLSIIHSNVTLEAEVGTLQYGLGWIESSSRRAFSFGLLLIAVGLELGPKIKQSNNTSFSKNSLHKAKQSCSLL